MKKFLVFLPLALLLIAGLAPAADFDGDSRDDVAIFRPSSGLWAVRGVTRVYFGGSGDEARPGDYNGDGISDIAIYRGTSGLWAVRDVTRVYFGQSSDTSIQGGGGERTYDYVVKAGDGADLERALESTVYDSVFIPAGDYYVSDPLTVSHVTQITGESRQQVIISLDSNTYLTIGASAIGCTIEKITVQNGGGSGIGNFYIVASKVTVRDCRSRYSSFDGFVYTSGASFVTFDNCLAEYAGERGFQGNSSVRTSRLIGCASIDSGTPTSSDIGFGDCYNLSNCYAEGEYSGYTGCYNITASIAYNCSYFGFSYCYGLSSCQVLGAGNTLYGINQSENLSACRVSDCDVNEYNGCDYYYGSGNHSNSCN